MIILEHLTKYKHSGQFFFQIDESLAQAAQDVPQDKSGVYLVYAMKSEELIYFGSTGKMQQDGRLKLRKGGMRDRIVKGKQFKRARHISWSLQMKKDKFTQLLVKWFITYDEHNKHIPASVEGKLIQEYFDSEKKLPLWNKEY
jgi:hypothetical protein